MRNVTIGAVACRQSPGVGAVALKVFGIGDAISAVDQSNVAVIFKIGRCETIAQAVRIKTEEGVMRKKERAARAHADVEFYAVVGVPVRIMTSIFRSGPAFAISNGPGILAGPAGIVVARRNPVCPRGHRQKISDHHFIEPNQRMVNAPSPERGPMPIQEMALRRLAKPIPFDAFPEFGDALIKRLFFPTRSMEVGARS